MQLNSCTADVICIFYFYQMQKIEIARRVHLPAIVEIYNQAVEEGFSTADMETFSVDEKRNWFDSHDGAHPVLVALDEQQVAGWLSLSAYRPGRGALAAVREVSYYVHRGWRRKGIATALLEHAVDFCRSNNIEFLLAIVIGRNETTISFLEKNSFSKWGTLPRIVNFNGVRCDHLYYGRQVTSDI